VVGPHTNVWQGFIAENPGWSPIGELATLGDMYTQIVSVLECTDHSTLSHQIFILYHIIIKYIRVSPRTHTLIVIFFIRFFFFDRWNRIHDLHGEIAFHVYCVLVALICVYISNTSSNEFLMNEFNQSKKREKNVGPGL